MKKILIVEDDPDLQLIFKSVLTRAGFEIEILQDGRSLPLEHLIPDLFIFDIELPFINGLELCKKVKADFLTQHIPVLIVSASIELLARASEACADDALEKPFDRLDLVDKVHALLKEASRDSLGK